MEATKAIFQEDIYADPDPSIKYACSPYTNSKKFTILMKWVLLTKSHPCLMENIKDYVKIHDINEKNAEGWTALMISARNSNTFSTIETIRLLIDANANVNLQKNNGSTALILASMYSNRDSTTATVQLLVDSGANPNLQNNDGETALTLELERTTSNKIDTTKILLNAGANPNLQDHNLKTPLMNILAWNDENNIPIIRLFIDAGANLNLQDNCNQTALLLAIKFSTVESIKMLIAAGADLNLLNNKNQNALMVAAKYNKSIEIIKILIDAGINPHLLDNNKQTALMLAAINNNSVEIIKTLIDSGANIDLKNSDGHTALTLANNINVRVFLTSLAIERKEIGMFKKMNYKYVLQQIPLHRNQVVFALGNMGHVITKISFDIKKTDLVSVYQELVKSNHPVIDYLHILNETDLNDKISSYLTVTTST